MAEHFVHSEIKLRHPVSILKTIVAGRKQLNKTLALGGLTASMTSRFEFFDSCSGLRWLWRDQDITYSELGAIWCPVTPTNNDTSACLLLADLGTQN